MANQHHQVSSPAHEAGTLETTSSGQRGAGTRALLISVWSGLGDVMFATPAIRHLRRALPDAWIAAAGLQGGPGIELLETNPYLDEAYFCRRRSSTPAGFKEALAWARSRKFDTGLELSHPAGWFFSLAGIPQRYRTGRRALWWAIPYRDSVGKELHSTEHFLRAAELITGPLERDGQGYDLVLTRKDREHACRLAGELGNSPFVSMHPGARCNANKRWNIDRFVELAARLNRDHGLKIVMVGGPDDTEAGQKVRGRLGNEAMVAAGRASLRETAALVSMGRLYVGNDSGPLQIAASTGVPTVGIYASSSPANYGPLSGCSRVVMPDADCSPCLFFPGYTPLYRGLRLRYQDSCRAMDSLDVEPVYQACVELLASGGQAPSC